MTARFAPASIPKDLGTLLSFVTVSHARAAAFVSGSP